MQKTYLLKIDQLERHLPIIPINQHFTAFH